MRFEGIQEFYFVYFLLLNTIANLAIHKQAPASLLEALEDHLKSLEGSKKTANLPK